MHNSSHRQGFTLVEISIVLVIIGLLIGGILAAQSMMETARTQAFIREFQQFDILTKNFQDVYKKMPGDYNNAATLGAIHAGNGNDVIDGSEPLFFFDHLRRGAKLPEKNTLLFNAWEDQQGSSVDKKLWWIVKPVNSFDPSTRTMDFGWGPLVGGDAPTDKAGDPYFIISTYYPNHTGAAGGIPVMTALAIDAKIDDGLPGRGMVRGGHFYNAAGFTNWGDCINYVAGGAATSYKMDSKWGCAVAFRYTPIN